MRTKNTQLDRAQLSLCVSLIENGVNPEALAVCVVIAVLPITTDLMQNAIKELRKESQKLQPDSGMSE